MKCEECEIDCQVRYRQVVRVPKERNLRIQDLPPEKMNEHLEDIEIMVCKQCWEKFDLLYQKMRDSVKYDAEHILKKAGDKLDSTSKEKLQGIIDQHKDN